MSFVGNEAQLIVPYLRLHHQALSYRGLRTWLCRMALGSHLNLPYSSNRVEICMGKDAKMVSEEETGRRKGDEMLVTDDTHGKTIHSIAALPEYT